MVMAHLFMEAGIKHSIAHCNFSLRGTESDGDESFVKNYANENSIPFYTITFDTVSFAASKGISIQMAARELRYGWFEKMILDMGFDSVAIAHNLNDNVETFFINLLRGTGLNGLTGMEPRNGNIIRPLLFAGREDITHYAAEKKIHFREDSSNQKVKYTRNRIRHKVLPELEKVTSNSLQAITNTINHLNNSAVIIDMYIEEIRQKIFKQTDTAIEVDIEAIKKLPDPEVFLFELFRKYGLSGRQTVELKTLLDASPGKFIRTVSHDIYKDRNNLIIAIREEEDRPCYQFSSIDDMRISGLFSDLCFLEPSPEPLPSYQRTACLDLSLLNFPVTVRRWERGDRFKPLGMKGFKKVSDFLIDQKVPLNAKEKTLVLLSDNNIAWLIGHRLDDRYKVTEKTKKILMITL